MIVILNPTAPENSQEEVPLPVTATKRKDVIMIRFRAPEQLQTKEAVFDIVCYLRLKPDGKLEINYSHHVTYTREGSVGPFSSEFKHRFPLDATLKAVIAIGAFQEFWSWTKPECRTMPGAIDAHVDQMEF